MSEPCFNDKNTVPNDSLLDEKLGTTIKYWQEIQEYAQKFVGNTTEEWKFYGKKYGWQLKTFLKKRNLFFLIPDVSFFRIVFVFGDKAVNEIEKSDISDFLKNTVINAKKYAEGRGLAVEVKNDEYLGDIKQLINIKINN